MEMKLSDSRLDRHLLAPQTIFAKTELARLRNMTVLALDVGARGGFDFLLAPIAPLVHFVGFDPDKSEIERLEEAEGQGWGAGVRYLPIALGQDHKARDLYLTRSPGCISLLESNPEVYNRYGRENLFTVDGTTQVETIGLDDAAQQYELQDAAYLKLDIQGAELEVLRSGVRLLDKSVTAIRTEVEFQPIYRDQPLFRDVDGFLSDQGFVLAGFHNPISWSLQSASSPQFTCGLDCLGDLMHADAIYLLHLDRYADADEAGVLRCLRGALIAMALGRMSYASTLLGRPHVISWLADSHGVNSRNVVTEARKHLKRHTRRFRIGKLVREIVRR